MTLVLLSLGIKPVGIGREFKCQIAVGLGCPELVSQGLNLTKPEQLVRSGHRIFGFGLGH